MKNQIASKKIVAIRLRKAGVSMIEIGKKLSISKSTLSGWFRDIKLSEAQKTKLLNSKKRGLIKARAAAASWHREDKQRRLVEVAKSAEEVLDKINLLDSSILELALSMLYLGEGLKSSEEAGLGNSDPLIVKTFILILKKNFNVPISKFRCELYLRADQNPEKLKKFWSEILRLPIENFKFVHLDERTKNSKTYADYHGVCLVRCGNVAIKRKLLNISKGFCERLLKELK